MYCTVPVKVLGASNSFKHHRSSEVESNSNQGLPPWIQTSFQFLDSKLLAWVSMSLTIRVIHVPVYVGKTTRQSLNASVYGNLHLLESISAANYLNVMSWRHMNIKWLVKILPFSELIENVHWNKLTTPLLKEEEEEKWSYQSTAGNDVFVEVKITTDFHSVRINYVPTKSLRIVLWQV